MGLKKWWKKRPYWFKGGIIGSIVLLLSYFSLFIIGTENLFADFLKIIFSLPLYFSSQEFLGCEGMSCIIGLPIFILATIIEGFLIGAIISVLFKK